ncbi:hypothetical protein GF324_04050 [bacterium]|nr:hypothetical protein [bacterium]
MKFTAYSVRKIGDTVRIHGGRALNLDLQGGLEEIMQREIAGGAVRLSVNLDGLTFLHSTLFAGLLATSLQLRSMDGTLFLVNAPGFVRWSMKRMGIAHKFEWIEDEKELDRLSGIRNLIVETYCTEQRIKALAEQIG